MLSPESKNKPNPTKKPQQPKPNLHPSSPKQTNQPNNQTNPKPVYAQKNLTENLNTLVFGSKKTANQ